MPLVTVTLRKGRSDAFRSAILASIHRSLVASGVPETDRFQRVVMRGALVDRRGADATCET